jgi:type III pantothenate kinase
MVLVIDCGNTRIKSAVFENDTLLSTLVFENENLHFSIENSLKSHPKINQIVVSSVGKIEKSAFSVFVNPIKLFFLDRNAQFPFQNKYATPETLGIDRMVLAAGAVLCFPKKNRLVIDAGTCVTFDFVDDNNQYWGGAIAPGLKLRYKSMNDYTAKLPLLETQAPEKTIGNTTQESIHSGVVNGLCFEIDGFIDALKTKNENFIIILTGGDAIFLAKRLKNTIFANSNFLLQSLNQLYLYQNKND